MSQKNNKGKVVVLDDDETDCRGNDRRSDDRKEKKEGKEKEDEKYDMPSSVAYNIFRQIVEASDPSNPDIDRTIHSVLNPKKSPAPTSHTRNSICKTPKTPVPQRHVFIDVLGPVHERPKTPKKIDSDDDDDLDIATPTPSKKRKIGGNWVEKITSKTFSARTEKADEHEFGTPKTPKLISQRQTTTISATKTLKNATQDGGKQTQIQITKMEQHKPEDPDLAFYDGPSTVTKGADVACGGGKLLQRKREREPMSISSISNESETSSKSKLSENSTHQRNDGKSEGKRKFLSVSSSEGEAIHKNSTKWRCDKSTEKSHYSLDGSSGSEDSDKDTDGKSYQISYNCGDNKTSKSDKSTEKSYHSEDGSSETEGSYKDSQFYKISSQRSGAGSRDSASDEDYDKTQVDNIDTDDYKSQDEDEVEVIEKPALTATPNKFMRMLQDAKKKLQFEFDNKDDDSE
eukprot:TRINITY_DN6077_c0_g2_i1.p1 TRINITY_DN6077_c0_g2~~TRINITY_DN6077_c0_g2_i1.p1  ORF type:complete len:459 (-),score=91.33 TRINITY_DN6077_c0_g2_i1:17-1393(-)